MTNILNNKHLLEEKEELEKIISDLPKIVGTIEALKECSQKFSKIMEKYLEKPQLLNPIARKLTGVCFQLILSNLKSKEVTEQLFHILYVFSNVQGSKRILKYFPHQVEYLEPISKFFLDLATDRSLQWKSKYLVLLWLSILIMNPFDLRSIDSSGQKLTLIAQLITRTKQFLGDSGPVKFASSFFLAKLFIRPDMVSSAFPEFLDWCVLGIKKRSFDTQHLVSGILMFLSYFFKSGKREEIIKYVFKLIEFLQEIKIYEMKNAIHRKYLIKLVQRLGLTLLKPRIASWRYQRGKRILLNNFQLKIDKNKEKNEEEEGKENEKEEEEQEEEFELPEEIEGVLGLLLDGLNDRSFGCRYSTAKGIARITNRLPKDFANEVVDSVLELFSNKESDNGWHGSCLALAELARRGLILPKNLKSIFPYLLQALKFDEIRGSYSVGSHVRDAASYVCWAFGRAFDKSVMKEFVPIFAPALVINAVFDREINCRRAASAAFQENVGRQEKILDFLFEKLNSARELRIRDGCLFGISNVIIALSKLININENEKIKEFKKNIVEYFSKAMKSRLLKGKGGEVMRVALCEVLKGLGIAKLQFNLEEIKIFQVFLESNLPLSSIPVQEGMIKCIPFFNQFYFQEESFKWVETLVFNYLKSIFNSNNRNLRKASVLSLSYFPSQLLEKHFLKILKVILLNICERKGKNNFGHKIKLVKSSKFNKGFVPIKCPEVRRDCIISLIRILKKTQIKPILIRKRKLNQKKKVIQKKGKKGNVKGKGRGRGKKIIIKEKNDENNDKKIQKGENKKPIINKENEKKNKIKENQNQNENENENKNKNENKNENEKEIEKEKIEEKKIIKKKINKKVNTKKKVNNTNRVNLVSLIFNSLIFSTRDYTVDKRGDVGSWVRKEGIKGLKKLLNLFLKVDPKKEYLLITETKLLLTLRQMIIQSVGRIDNVRNLGGTLFSKIIHNEKLQNYHTDLKIIANNYFSNYKEINFSKEEISFPLFSKLFFYPQFQNCLIEGFVLSSGGLSQSVALNSSESLINFLKENQKNIKLLDQVCNSIIKLAQRFKKIDRVIVPLFNTMEKILSSNCFDPLKELQSGRKFANDYFSIVKMELNSSTKISKYYGAISSLCNLFGFGKQLQIELIKYLCLILSNKYPVVRKSAAEHFYISLLTEELLVLDTVELNEDAQEEISEILSDIDWDLISLEETIKNRNKILSILNLPIPKIIINNNQNQNNNQNNNQTGTYKDLVREMGF
ncbi:beta-tubulin cofactor d [Anaeramoeba flamelloides]|uniref:Beta-tubulin cofactor d n=1 Tax=Anaeramoeba flamelloides TaxID=1746091 RepID=A0AAV7YA02_9EUKA|nr:beta-tubulin cofactor d [Anaeramoeba flamelloides]